MERSKTDPAIKERAKTVRAEIEREAEVKRNAIAAIFGGESTLPSPTSPSKASSARSATQADRA